ncbi:MAG: hypothetical protein ABIH72_03055 [archaeon]
MVKLSFRLWILIIALALSLLAIAPWQYFNTGVMIKTVDRNTTSYEEGLRPGMVIIGVNNQPVETIIDYTVALNEIFPNNSLLLNKTKLTIQTTDSTFVLFIDQPPKITVGNQPRSKIKTGLDLQGGARALVAPEEDLSAAEMSDLIAVTSNRLNVFGISDVVIRPVADLGGNNYMLIEVAGATPSDLEELVAKQGKFEAKIGNETAFIGGNKDITSVCRNDASCAGIESCYAIEGAELCRFRFTIYLSEQAAKRHADITSKLGVNTTESGRYLDKKLELFIDDTLVDSLYISEDLQGQVTTQISIQGSGSGSTREEAFNAALKDMNHLQTVLITGSLPFKLEIVKLDSISPVLGRSFIQYLLFAGIASILVVALIVLVRYRNIKSSLALILTSFSEIFIILGFAAFVSWNLDLPSIAGILIAIGTGVDQQIIILDESRIGREKYSIVERMKRALFVIVGVYFTALASLLPIYWAGAGLLRGFAFTTIVGVTIGVLITRPAFADIIKKIESS